MAREALPLTGKALVRSAEMRYQGQSFEINVPLPEGPITDVAPILAAFHGAYETIYGYVDRTAPVEVVDLRLQVVGAVPRPAGAEAAATVPRPVRPAGPPAGLPGRGLPGCRRVPGARDLRPGDTFEGPAVVEQYDTTVLVPGGYRVRVDGWGNLIGEAD